MAEQNLAQKEINQAEWRNPDNWGGSKALAIYFSKKDRRIWVPPQKPSIGWTVNLAHTGGVFWLIGICVGLIVVMIAVTIFAGDLFLRYAPCNFDAY